MTEGGKNYKLDELIGYYLIYLHYIIIPTNPNLSISPLPTIKIEKPNLLTKFTKEKGVQCTPLNKYSIRELKFFTFRDNFQPITVRVIDKVNTHIRVFKADATHFFVKGVSLIKVLYFKC